MAETVSHWSRIGESGTLLGMKLLLLAYRLFGHRGFQLLLFPVAGYFYLRRGEARKASREYLAQIGPYLDEEQRRELSSFRQFRRFGEILLDKLLVWMGEIDLDQVVFETPGVIEDFEAGHEGGLIVVSHLGNFEICGAIANQVPQMRLTILVGRSDSGRRICGYRRGPDAGYRAGQGESGALFRSRSADASGRVHPRRVIAMPGILFVLSKTAGPIPCLS